MRIGLVFASILGVSVGQAAELPLFFGSGSNFSGPIVRHKVQGDPRVEAHVSQVNKTITLRMVTLADKAIVVVARPVPGADKTTVSMFQSENNDEIFKAASAAFEEKVRHVDLVARYRDPWFRAEAYDSRDYKNKQFVVGLHLLAEGAPGAQRTRMATIILHPADEDNLQGELLIYGRNQTIVETIWFDVKREGEKRGAAPVVPAPVPAPKQPLPAPMPVAPKPVPPIPAPMPVPPMPMPPVPAPMPVPPKR